MNIETLAENAARREEIVSLTANGVHGTARSRRMPALRIHHNRKRAGIAGQKIGFATINANGLYFGVLA